MSYEFSSADCADDADFLCHSDFLFFLFSCHSNFHFLVILTFLFPFSCHSDGRREEESVQQRSLYQVDVLEILHYTRSVQDDNKRIKELTT